MAVNKGEIGIYGILRRDGGDNILVKTDQVQDSTLNKTQEKINQEAVVLASTATSHIINTNNPHNVTKEQIGLSNVTNDSQVKRDEMGVANGVATLDKDGTVPVSQLPSYIEDTYIAKTKNSTDVQIADGSTLGINKFVGDLTYDSTTGSLFIGYPTSTGESIDVKITSLPEATEDTPGLLSANDKSKLNALNWGYID